jgi:hypothetical protein
MSQQPPNTAQQGYNQYQNQQQGQPYQGQPQGQASQASSQLGTTQSQQNQQGQQQQGQSCKCSRRQWEDGHRVVEKYEHEDGDKVVQV